MAVRFYLIPVQVVDEVFRGPKYLKWFMNPDGLDVRWSCKDYGAIDMMSCAVGSEEQGDHDYLAAQADVYQWIEPLDGQMTAGERAEVTTYLESAWIPANWITPADTRREAVRTVTGMFLFMQRLTAITGSTPIEWGVELNTQYQNLDLEYQEAIVDAFDTLGYDSSVIRDNWTLRVLLKNAADQWGETPILFGFVTL
jgi:hypothetical protein